jgi:large subunit ribosomal protein L22
VEAKAFGKYIRSTPRKARLVADEVRGKMVSDALSLLDYSIHKKVSGDISKVIKSAVANMQSKHENTAIAAEELVVKEILIDHGPTMKRFRPRAQGRAGRILKRMCHISVTVAS